MMNTDRTWLSFNSEHFEGGVRAVFSYVGNIVVATVIISAGAHVSGEVPSIALFGILRHSFIGKGVIVFGAFLLVLNFVDGLYKLSKLNWHITLQLMMAICYFVLSARLIQLILAFRTG